MTVGKRSRVGAGVRLGVPGTSVGDGVGTDVPIKDLPGPMLTPLSTKELSRLR